jgi:hypothetical protein
MCYRASFQLQHFFESVIGKLELEMTLALALVELQSHFTALDRHCVCI